MSSSSIVLACTVRGCGEPLAASDRGLACARGHAFDRARSGYVNLLQPHDRRSLDAGDSKEAVLARRRLQDGGWFAKLVDAIAAMLARAGVERGARALDLGCGEGSVIAELARRFELDAAGLDLSAHAVDAAARKHGRTISWLVANGDRRLPFADGALDVVLSVTARRPKDELARVVRANGLLACVRPASDDLAELRTVLMGNAIDLAAKADVAAELAPAFALVEERRVSDVRRASAAELADLALSTYRGARRAREERLRELDALDVTTSFDVVLLRRAPTP